MLVGPRSRPTGVIFQSHADPHPRQTRRCRLLRLDRSRAPLGTDNPVARTSVARQLLPTQGMQPFTEPELNEVCADIAAHSQILADVVWLLAWTGLRWSVAPELRVSDFVEVPMPRLLIRRSAPETVDAKPTKSGRSRHIPLSDRSLAVAYAIGLDGM